MSSVFQIGIAMSVTWILCYLAVHINTVGFWWLFVICNSVLGFIIFFYVATDRRTKNAWRNQVGKLTQNIRHGSSNDLSGDSDKMNGGKQLTINNSVSVTTMTAGMTSNGGPVNDQDSMKSEEDNESAQRHSTLTADLNAPLTENHEAGEPKVGIVNPAIDKEGE